MDGTNFINPSGRLLWEKMDKVAFWENLESWALKLLKLHILQIAINQSVTWASEEQQIFLHSRVNLPIYHFT